MGEDRSWFGWVQGFGDVSEWTEVGEGRRGNWEKGEGEEGVDDGGFAEWG